MREIIPYLLKYYFDQKPTSNKELSQAFWKLMGKNVEISGKRRWTTTKYGVPCRIHRLTNEYILAEISTDNNPIGKTDYPEYMYSYVLGSEGEKQIEIFVDKYPRHLIDQEISKYLDKES